MGGTEPKCSEYDFINLFKEHGPTKTARILKSTKRCVLRRRANLEKKLGHQITGPEHRLGTRDNIKHPHRLHLDIENGQVLIGSDAHLWPGDQSTAWRAFLLFHQEFKPKASILNGDVLDFPQISRHAPIGWDEHPTVQEEVEYAQDCLNELEKVTGKKCDRIWTLGNHDGRYETRLRTIAPEFARIHGFHLKDHFPLWRPCWSVWINSQVVIKHRFRSGIHAPHNNTMWSGLTTITGHLHSAKVVPFTDYRGTRFGVDTGCLADPDAKAFVDYTEDNPKNWRSAFAVLTFEKGMLLWPELVVVVDDNTVQFRGKLIKV